MKPTNRSALAPVLGLALALCATACMDPEAPGNLVPRTVEEDPIAAAHRGQRDACCTQRRSGTRARR